MKKHHNYQGYIQEIQRRIAGERVLDIGCLGSYERSQLKRHRAYMQNASEIIGIDIHRGFLKSAADAGFNNIHYCDITNSDDTTQALERFGKFKHIIATEVIEHIGNITNFLDNTYRLMEDDAYLYLTTPNVRSTHWVSMFLEYKIYKVNEDHVCWFDQFTLSNMLKRSNLEIKNTNYYAHVKDTSAAKHYFKLKFKPQMGRRMLAIVQKREVV